jgi:hypothetical protein
MYGVIHLYFKFLNKKVIKMMIIKWISKKDKF